MSNEQNELVPTLQKDVHKTVIEYAEEHITDVNVTEEGNQPIASVSTKPITAKTVLKELVSWVFSLIFVFIAAFFIVTFVGQRTQVIGSSMENTLHSGDNLIIDKISYRIGEPKRFDIIVLKYQFSEDTHYIKRIIGLPGERIQIIEGYVFINGEQLLDDVFCDEPIHYAGLAENEILLGDDEYFVLGDNRNNSKDSRFEDVGTIKKGILEGKAWIRIYPFDSFGSLYK